MSGILLNYLTPAADACWRWDGIESVVWRDGTTIAFQQEIVAILQELSECGWPSFNALVLVLAACRPTWSSVVDENLAHAKELVQEAAKREQIVLLWFSRSLSGLQAIAELSAHVRESAEARLTLCRTVFGKGQVPRLSPAMAKQNLQFLPYLRDALDRPPVAEAESHWWPILRSDLHVLSIGLAELSEERLALKTKTGVEELPAPAADVPLTTATQVRQVLDADDDDEIGFVVRLVRSVLGALPMYQRLSEPEGLPLGGIVDLKNRGQLDHLVLSELANDDDVLSARLALSEALYLRRETPERTPDGARLILLDVGVRQWGTARLVALATALALAAQGDVRQPVRAWVAQGAGLREINLGTREGVVEALACLRPEPTPALALPAFVRQGRARDELMLITGPRALVDPELEQALTKAGYAGLIATTTSAGAFRLLQRGARGQRELAAAQLDLERCRIRPNRRRAGARTAPTAGASNADPINRIEPFPLRLPHHLELAQAIALPGGEGVLSVSPRGHLTWWDDPTAGPRRLLSDLPIGRVMALGRSDDRVWWVLIHRRSDRHLLLCTSDDGSTYTTTSLKAMIEPQTAWAEGRVLLVVDTRVVYAFGLDGVQLGAEFIPLDSRWSHGHFVRSDTTWYRISSGAEPVTIVKAVDIDLWNKSDKRFAQVIDIEGRDGPWVVLGLTVRPSERPTQREDIQLPSLVTKSQNVQTKQVSWRIKGISRNGLRMIFQGHPNGGSFGYDLSKKQHFKADPRLLEPGIMAWTEANQGILAHTTAVSVDQGCLRVHNQRENVHVFGVHGGVLRLRFGEKLLTPKGKRLELTPGGERHRRWHRADHNGVVVFLDGGGLLHLTDTTGKLPAIALMLADGDTACWCSEGWVHGPRRFLGPQASAPAAQVATVLDAYVRRLA